MKVFGKDHNIESDSSQSSKSTIKEKQQRQLIEDETIKQQHLQNLTHLQRKIPNKNSIAQTCIRQRLFTWAINASVFQLQLKLKTVEHALRLFDKIVMIRNRFFKNNTESKLFLASILFISSKYEEIYPPCVSDFAFIFKDAYTVEDILRTQFQILSLIQFNLNFPLVSDWYGTLFNQQMPQWGYQCYPQLPSNIDQKKLAIIIREIQELDDPLATDKMCKIAQAVKRYNKGQKRISTSITNSSQKSLFNKNWLKKA